MLGRVVKVNNAMQDDYEYKLVRKQGDLSDLIGFTPDLTPIQMIEYGIMGGNYFSDVVMDFEYPNEIRKLIFRKSTGVHGARQRSYNYFKVFESQGLAPWDKSGGIVGDDPRGWIEWYLRTWRGRRDPEVDAIQIKRWRYMRRYLAQLQSACEVGDHSCQPRRRQALLHWAFDTVNKY